MADEGKENDAEKAQIEVSPEPKLSENVEEDKEVLKEDGGIKKMGEEKEKSDANKNENHKENPKESEEDEVSLPLSNGNEKENAKEGEKSENSSPPLDGKTEENTKEIEKGECSSSPRNVDSSLFTEENRFLPDLKDFEKKALMDLRSKLEEAILTNKLFKEDKKQEYRIEKLSENEKHDKGKAKVEEQEHEKLEKEVEIDKDFTLWGVPLLPSKGDKGTDILLSKFLRAREFKANEAFEMLKNTLEWRKENKVDSITEEDFGNEYDSVGYMKGLDREGHPVCYNVYGVFANDEMYNKTFGTEASRERFLRWRFQLLEKGIQKLDFRPGGISTLLQINDLKNTPGPSRKDLRLATKRAVGILQDNYPEFVARNIFINVPFWYYAFNALLSPFLTQRTKSKFVFSRPSRVTETLLRYIAAEEIPVIYGGLRRENDPEFSIQDAASEVNVKAGATENIEIPLPEAGTILIWDLTIIGWDVNYKEEFVPTDEGSYTLIVKKERKITWQEESIRNTFKNKEPGKLVITIENGIFKKKRVLYRYKIKNPSA
ncbi:Phosphatidylinositol transfer protein SEC14 [Handroanthus impetiginosus]|uniref:Phosphatidylinositol transfer protein SEC14 n=1 Tax=Handroanthus impetiginosus TaxID=429701 RepID=A0A2G9GIB8_9LAMI|nr:Phosphatidylinositol transfer protein SEC14 [Handroanthus impetiginosus]